MNFLHTFIRTSADAVSGEVSQAAGTTPTSPLGSWFMPLMLLGVFAIFYFLVIRPEKKRKKKAEEERESIKVGDTVISIGGITGEIESIRTNTVTIFTGDCSMDLQKWAIRSVVADEEKDADVEKSAE